MRRSLPRHKGAVRQIVQMAGPFFLPTRRTIDAFQMQRPVHFLSARRLGGPIGDAPGLGPGVVVVSPAFVTGAVPGGEGDRLVEKEQLRVATWRHHHAMASAERGVTNNPVVVRPTASAQLPVRIVEDATIPHEITACRIDLDLAI